MAILITGGCGYIGSHTCLELIKAGQDIVVLDNFYNSKIEPLHRVEELCNTKIKFYEADIRDEAALCRVFEENDIDTVIHFAGLKAVGESVEKPLLYFENNVGGTVTLCRVMNKYGVKRIVFSSSATVYGRNPVPYTEDMPVGDVTNPYGRTKYMVEEILRDLCTSDPEWSVVLLRYFNPIGSHESGRIGEDPNGIPNNLMPYVLQVAVGRREKLSVYGNDYPTPDGTGIRDYIHVVDLALGHVKAVAYARSHTGAEAINLGTGRGTSVLELVHAFEKVYGKPLPYVIAPRRAGDLPECYAATDKARDLLGWEATRDIDDMCRDSWKWQSENPMGYTE